MKFAPRAYNSNCWRFVLPVGVTDPHPTRTGTDGDFVNAETLFGLSCDSYKVVSLIKQLKRTHHWSLTKTEAGLCSVNLEILCSEPFKTRLCETRGTSPSLGVEAVAFCLNPF